MMRRGIALLLLSLSTFGCGAATTTTPPEEEVSEPWNAGDDAPLEASDE